MDRLNIVARGSAAAILIVGIVAITSAATRPGKSHSQCHREATSLKHNANDESDRWSYDNYMARCQYGTDAQTAAMIEHRIAVRGDRLDRRDQQIAQRQKPRNEIDRRVLAQAEQKYQRYGVFGFDYCRDLGALRAVRHGDEEDPAGGFMRDCMAGKVSRR